MKTHVKEITPQWAAQILETRNPNNRRLRETKVAQYASDMTHNRWRLTHQGIAFDERGDLLDGQHRLAAVVASKSPVKMMVTTGIPKSFQINGHSIPVFPLIDAVAPRRPSDALWMGGHKNAVKVGSIAASVVRMCSNQWSGPIGSSVIIETVRLMSNSVDIIASIGIGEKIVSIRTSGLAAFAFYHTTDKDAAEKLLSETMRVTGLPKSPTRALASWFSRKSPGGALQQQDDCAACAAAIFHAKHNHEVSKVIGGDQSIRWLLSTNPTLAKSIKSLL